MAGGMNRKDGHVAPIGVRAGIPEDPDERPWELPRGVAPRDGHVELYVDSEWVQALLIEQRVEGSLWHCRVVWAERGIETRVRNEWVIPARIRPRTDPTPSPQQRDEAPHPSTP